MTNSATVESNVQGAQEPRIFSLPPSVGTSGDDAIELAAFAGLVLDPWQGWFLRHLLSERPDGSWAAFQAGLCVSRQNGKGAILEARELAGLFLLDERLIIHSAHQFDTSLEAFRRLLELIDSRDEFSRRVKRVSRAHGEEGVELYGPAGRKMTGGQRIRFRTRTKGGGRGFSGDTLILDEAMIVPESFHGAILPILSARPNPQVLYTGSAVDQQVHEHGLVFAALRERALKGGDDRLLYAEWSGDATLERAMDPRVASDQRIWAQANPGLGIRITSEYVDAERRALDQRSFAVERLGVADWPSTLLGGSQIISLEHWRELTDRKSMVENPVCLAFDVTPDRSASAIAAAGRRQDDLGHLEVVEHRRGTGWVVRRLVELMLAHEPVAVVWDARSPAASLEKALRDALDEAGVALKDGDREILVPTTGAEMTDAYGLMIDAIDQRGIRHGDQPELAAAIKGAGRRSVGDGFAWSRRNSGVDICPLVGVTLAWWGFVTQQAPDMEPMVAFR